MLISQSDALKKENSWSCTVWEYPFPNSNIGIAVVKITGMYPDTGRVVNHACDLIYFVLSWNWVITIDKEVHSVKKWDSIFINKGKTYKVEGKNLFVNLTSEPAWYPEQYEEIEEI
jgi:mannose-6-phosphate isomerase-like protein (cupin superfamily)